MGRCSVVLLVDSLVDQMMSLVMILMIELLFVEVGLQVV